MSSVIGIDLGGTKISATRYNTADWCIEASHRESTKAAESFLTVYDQIVATIKLLKTPTTTGVGIGVPGLIKQPAGVILTVPNIPGAEEFPLKQKLEQDTGFTVQVDNDAKCFALDSFILERIHSSS